jgi:hypothetical protein
MQSIVDGVCANANPIDLCINNLYVRGDIVSRGGGFDLQHVSSINTLEPIDLAIGYHDSDPVPTQTHSHFAQGLSLIHI